MLTSTLLFSKWRVHFKVIQLILSGTVNLFESCAWIFYERIILHCGCIMWVLLSHLIPIYSYRIFGFTLWA